MSLQIPESMDELCYMTRRKVGEDGKIIAWVERGNCPKCKEGLMSKPINPKTGKFKIRSSEYVCNKCGYEVQKEEFEETLNINIIYTCPHCKKEGETTVPFKRKGTSIWNEEKQKKVAVKAIVFNCDHCGEKILITKKMKS